MSHRVLGLVVVMALVAPLTGCGNACDDLADEFEQCCEEGDELSRDFCLGLADAIREQGDSDQCQEALDEGVECSPENSSGP